MSGFTVVEGRVVNLGTVSGTDETPIGLYEPTHAVRVYVENPSTINNAPVYQVGVTSINTTASGIVTINGAGSTSVQTVGTTITINTPADQTDIDGVTVSGSTVTGSITLQGLGAVSLHRSGQTITISGGLRVLETDNSPDTVIHTLVVGTGTLINMGAGVARLAGGAGGGITVHGNLSGLFADDHPQYSLVAGTRPFTGTVGGITPTAPSHLTTKDYVDARAAQKAIVGVPNNITVSSGTDTVTVSGVTVVSNGIAYISDASRGGKYLSTTRQNYMFGRNGTRDNAYLDVGPVQNSAAGWIVPRKGTIVSITSYWTVGESPKTLDVFRNDDVTPLFSHSGVVTTSNIEDDLNADIDDGDRLKVFVNAVGATISNTTCILEVAWRL